MTKIMRAAAVAAMPAIGFVAIVQLAYSAPLVSAGGSHGFWHYLYVYRWQFFKGTMLTIEISVAAMALAVVFGLVLALCRLYGPRSLSRLSLGYVEFVRGTPLLVQLYFIYYGLPNLPVPQLLHSVGVDHVSWLAWMIPASHSILKLNALTAAIVGVGLNYAAYEAEIYRAGIMAIPRQQTEAAYSLGLSRAQTIRHIILPQALRIVVPPVTNDFVSLFKDTSIVSIVSITELTKTFTNAGIATQEYLGFAIVTAIIYFAISYPVSAFARSLERRLHSQYDSHAQPL